MSTSPNYTTILHEVRAAERVGVITINRPKQLNALNPDVVREVAECALAMDRSPEVGAIVLTGSGTKAFAAGADIKSMADQDYMSMYCNHAAP